MLSLNQKTYEFQTDGPGKEFFKQGSRILKVKCGGTDFNKKKRVVLNRSSNQGEIDEPFLGLFINLGKPFFYFTSIEKGKVSKRVKREFYTNHFTFAYLPEPPKEFEFNQGPTRYIRFDLDKDLIESFIPNYPFLQELLPHITQGQPYYVHKVPILAWDRFIEEVLKIWFVAERGIGPEYSMTERWYMIITTCLDSIARIKGKVIKSDLEKLEKVKQHLMHNLSGPLNIQIIAERFGYSVKMLELLFKESNGTSILKYHLEIRMNKAFELLQNTNLTLEEISKKIGFEHQTNFSRSFKKSKGLSPLKARRIKRKENIPQ